jgi:hypothetical protein
MGEVSGHEITRSRTNRCGLQGAQRADVTHLIETGSMPYRPGHDTCAASRTRLFQAAWDGQEKCGLPDQGRLLTKVAI